MNRLCVWLVVVVVDVPDRLPVVVVVPGSSSLFAIQRSTPPVGAVDVLSGELCPAAPAVVGEPVDPTVFSGSPPVAAGYTAMLAAPSPPHPELLAPQPLGVLPAVTASPSKLVGVAPTGPV